MSSRYILNRYHTLPLLIYSLMRYMPGQVYERCWYQYCPLRPSPNELLESVCGEDESSDVWRFAAWINLNERTCNLNGGERAVGYFQAVVCSPQVSRTTIRRWDTRPLKNSPSFSELLVVVRSRYVSRAILRHPSLTVGHYRCIYPPYTSPSVLLGELSQRSLSGWESNGITTHTHTHTHTH